MIVVETNVIAHLWLPGDETEVSERLLARDPAWASPVLWRSEFRSVLGGWIRRGRLDLARAERIAADAEDLLAGREFLVPSAAVLRRVAGSGCSAYDCEFVVLAERLGVPLVTRDREILSAFPAVSRHPEAFLAS